MKKITVMLALAVMTASLFAVDMSIGAGATFDYSSSTMKMEVFDVEDSLNMAFQILGFGAFFDATYLQIGLDYGFIAAGEITEKVTGFSAYTEDFTWSFSFLNFESRKQSCISSSVERCCNSFFMVTTETAFKFYSVF